MSEVPLYGGPRGVRVVVARCPHQKWRPPSKVESAAGRWLGGRHADIDRVSDELSTEAEGRFPHEPEGTPASVFYTTDRTCLV